MGQCYTRMPLSYCMQWNSYRFLGFINQMRKYILISIFGTLTFTTSQAFMWQYRRYHECVKKWERVHSQFRYDHVPEKYSLGELNSLKDYEYRVIQVRGRVEARKTSRVSRYKDGRAGYLLVGCLEEGGASAMVNLGWVPEEFEGEIELGGVEELRCMVKKPEVRDFLSQKKGDKLDFDSYIDIAKLNHKFGTHASAEFFLERVGKETEGGGLGNDLYPVPVFGSSIEKPYLTPDVHQGYFMFWGSCTGLGLLTIARLLRA